MSDSAIVTSNVRRKAMGPAFLVPLVVAVAMFPLLSGSSYVQNVGTLGLTFAVLATGLNLVFGYAGLLSFAQIGFWGIGAYVSALCTVNFGWSPWLAFPAGGAFAAITALLVGIPAMRVSRPAFVIVSLTFTLLTGLLSRSWVEVTRGPLGIPGLPAPSLGFQGAVMVDGHDPAVFYCIMLAFAVLAIGIMYAIVRSPIGRIMLAVNQNEVLARSQGIRAKHYQLLAFVIAALFTGMAGGLYSFHLSIVDPTIFDSYYNEMLLIIVIVGGAGNFWTVILSSFVFTTIPELLRFSPELRMVLFGLVLIVVALMLPGGIGGYLQTRRVERLRREMRP